MRAVPIRVAAGGFAAWTALAGCATSEPPGPAAADPTTAVYAEPPLPDGATTETAPVPAPATTDCGDPTASLRPDGITEGPTLDAIRARGRLIVGLDWGSNLFSFRDPVTGILNGFDVDIAKEIAFDLFGDRERVEYRILNSADRLAALENNLTDIVAKTMTITCDRRQRVTFSTGYYATGQRVLVVHGSGIDGIADLADRSVCVAAGTTSQQRVRTEQPAARLLTVPTWADCLVAMQQGQVDAISTDDSILAGLAAQDPYLEIVGARFSNELYGIGIHKGNDDLVRFVNRTLERIRADGTWNRIYNRWLSVLGPSPGPPPARYED
nr:glutamate ABC transporter substrate-binding protein [Skermania piniformis]